MTSRLYVLLAIGLWSASAAPAASQVVQTSPCTYDTCAVRHTIGFFGERLVRGSASEEILKIDFTGRNAADFLGRVESAAGPAREFRTRRTRSAFLGIFAGAAAGYFAVRAYEGRSVSDRSRTADAAVVVGGVAVSIVAAVEATRSRNSLSRAIWEFNRAPVP